MISTTRILQVIGLIGFVLAFLQIGIGWFIGFFFSGIFFLTLKDENGKRKNLNIILGVIIVIYSFYALYTQSNIF